MQRINLDHNATTPLDPEVLAAMLPYLVEEQGNPSSLHTEGRAARRAIEEAREEVAGLLGGEPDEVIFTSGATEANVLGIRSATQSNPARRTLLVSAVEHPSVLETVRALGETGHAVATIPVDETGRLRIEQLELLLTTDVAIVALMGANNEVGTIQPVEEVTRRCEKLGIRLHVDLVQAIVKTEFTVRSLDFEGATAAISAHKINGPKGIGALWAHRETRIFPHLLGGGQERGRRAGTENVAAIVGFGTACRRAASESQARRHRLRVLTELFLERTRALIPDFELNSPAAAPQRIPGTLSLRIPGVLGETIMIALDLEGVSISLGSACSSGAAEPSHVLAAMCKNKVENLGSFRISLSHLTSEADVKISVDKLATVSRRARANDNP